MIDLTNLGDRGVTIYGETPGGLLGFGYGGRPGDFNGDGVNDLILPAPGGGGNNATVYVVFGGDTLLDGVDLANLGTEEGVKLTGEADSFAGRSVSSAGDVNGDGIDDVIIGADFTGATDAGAAYVVYGSQTLGAAPIDLTNLGDAGFVIQGNGSEGMGRSVFGIGDINGDGIDDVAVGANGNNDNATVGGAVYVIFGTDQGFPSVIDGNNLGSSGFEVLGANVGDAVGVHVTAGDFNGDGKADLVFNSGTGIGFLFSSGTTPTGSVVVGADDRTVVFDTGVTGTNNPIAVGDFDGDGKADLMVGLPTDAQGGTARGSLSAVLSSDADASTTVEDQLRDLSATTTLSDYALAVGGADNEKLGTQVADIGDFNGDGADDFSFELNGDSFAGQGSDLYLFGSILAGKDRFDNAIGPDSTPDGLTSFKGANYANVYEYASYYADGVGDVNGDGLADMMVGTERADANDNGIVSIIFGALGGSGSDASDNLTGGALPESLDLGAGDDTCFGQGGDDTLAGGLGDDLLAGGDDNDSLSGDDGNDRAYGQSGDDVCDGGDGNDSLFGNLGDDTLTGDAGDDMAKAHVGDDIVDGGDGNDLLFGGGSSDSVVGGADDDTVNGNSGGDTVSGEDGNDLVRGQGGNDMCFGGVGDDTIRGMSGFDSMFGGAGDDLLSGGVGNDTSTGGDGADIFEFAQGQGSNVVTDFVPGIDNLSIVGISSIDDLNIVHDGTDSLISLASEGDAATLLVRLQFDSAYELLPDDFFFQ